MSHVLLCKVLDYPYFKDNVFNGKAFWENNDDNEIPPYVRDTPSDEMYNECQDEFQWATHSLPSIDLGEGHDTLTGARSMLKLVSILLNWWMTRFSSF